MLALPLSLFLATACQTAPATKPGVSSPVAVAGGDPFPAPSGKISVSVGPGEDMKLEKLLDEFSKVTGITFLVAPETRMVLQKSTTGLNRSIDIPASEVYPVVETILIQNDLALVPLHENEPRLASVCSLTQNRGSNLRNAAVTIPASALPVYARHPAVLVTTVLDLPHTDVRTISNSMRTMFTDANTQQIIPVGNSNSLILTGFGTTISGMSRMLQEVEETAKRDMAEDEKRRTDQDTRRAPPPPGQAPAKDEKPK
jgi:type II secretory pathway component GspD/PulD (secretin)